MKTIKFVIFSVIIASNLLNAQNQDLINKSIPFKLLENKYVLINCGVGEASNLTFFFDTGASQTLLDKNIAQKNDIKPNHQQAVEGAGGSVIYDIALDQEINIDGIKIDNVNLVLEDLARLKSSLGESFDGIIGYDLLKKYITELDFENKKINLYDFNTKLDLKSYTEHSFTFDGGIPIPQINVTITLDNGKEYTGKAFFDSGAGLTVLMNTPFNLENKILEQSKKSITTSNNNLSKKSISNEIIIRNFSFLGYDFSEMPITISSDNSGVSSYKNYLGILGSEIINRFNFILDYKNKKIYLKPNSLYKNSFNYPLTGFKLIENETKQILISDIIEQSPFYADGLREGDEIISINGIKDNLKEFKQLLKTENKEIVLHIKRGEKTFSIKRVLKRLI